MTNATPTTTTIMTDDPFDAAMEAPNPTYGERHYFGLVYTVDPRFVMLEKGVGKRVFDPTRDPANKRFTSINLQVEVQGQSGPYTLDQDVLNFSKEWDKFTLPSIKAIGKDLRSLKNTWVELIRKPTGEKYTNKNGEEKDRTAFVFVRAFADEAACNAAADEFYTPRSQRAPNQTPPAATPVASVAPDPSPSVDDAQRATFAGFLPVLWQASNNDPETFYRKIGEMPQLAALFTKDSPEVQALTGVLAF